ncbi:ABC transporter substrate-binding protein [Frankia gtarii]|uniref:ABC transporter substrate-binding protein n=1 Tax=Frankia gtarii TaxID=2950102 RepID=UPI0021C200DE|nr:ABC transporter substrate-binding protein [Frankia gtarii]
MLAAACGSGGSSSGKPARPTVDAQAVKAGPPVGWSDGGYKPDTSKMRCSKPAADPTRGITDTQITVGGLAYLTSPNGSTMAGAELGAKARFDRANAEGGINGRKINYVGTLDDGQDPARSGQQAKVLVDQKHVFAAVPLMTSFANYLDTFCAETVPYFGWGFNAGYCNTSIGFGITGCLLPDGTVATTTYGLLIKSLFGGNSTGKTVALVGVDNDTARGGNRDIAEQVRIVGIKVVYNENSVPIAGITDTTAVVNKVMTSNGGQPPDLVLYVADFNSVVKLTGALKAAGFKGKNLNVIGYDPRLAAIGFPGLQDSYTLMQWEPGVDNAVPAVRQMADDFKKYAPSAVLSLPAMAGYWSADMFVTAATKAGRDLNVNSLLKMLNSNYSYSVPGAVAETRWPLSHFATTPCGSISQLVGKQYNIITKLSCGSLVK